MPGKAGEVAVRRRTLKIWILNHYATDMYFNGAGRHHWFAKYLIRDGHEAEVFCSNQRHNSAECVPAGEGLYVRKTGKDNVPYTFVKTPVYKGNGSSRIKNMAAFWKNVKKVCSSRIKKEGKPDVILASSVHPLTLLAGLQLGKKLGIPCVCEVRDLWPMTLVEYGMLQESSIITRLLYRGEKWIYSRADKLIFTFAGGKDYIMERGWTDSIDLNKVFYINNGIDLEIYNDNMKKHPFEDPDLDSEKFKIIYAGSMGPPNQIDAIVEAAENVKKRGLQDIKFILYGTGGLKERLEQECFDRGLDNVVFKGLVAKEKIPYILSKGNMNIVMIKDSPLYRYGISLNKLFDYLASGNPIICNNPCVKSVLRDKRCGIINCDLTQAVMEAYHMSADEYDEISNNAADLVKEYDYCRLTQKLMDVIS